MHKRKHPNSPRSKNNSRKQKKFSHDLPQFLDAESSITASRFATKRIPEMQTLWNKFLQSSTVNHDDESYFLSRGCKQSKRHLRRRTGSHHRRKRHRFPNGEQGGNSNGDMQADSSKGVLVKDETKVTSRKVRRKPQFLREIHSQWKKKNPGARSQGESTNDSNWLETHLWHSKRFYMTPPLPIYDNWCIPLGHTNRGSRAALRLAKSKSTIQDATWTTGGQSIVLETKNRSHLLLFLESICGGNGTHSAPFLSKDCVIAGLEIGHGLIHEVGCTFPGGVIGPASFIFGKGAMKSHFVRINVHGSILTRVMQMVQNTVPQFKQDKDIEVLVSTDANCLIRIRGSEASKSLVDSLSISSSNNDALVDWSTGHLPHDFHTLLPHGTIMRVKFKGVKNNHSRRVDDNQDDMQHWDEECATNRLTKRLENDHSVLEQPMVQPDELVIISQAPNAIYSSDKNKNNAVSGFDIICSPSVTCEIFSALGIVGGACAIGFIEDSCNNMEAEPPLPVWPRDFPDTADGKDYAAGNDSGWKVMKYCIEEGISGGRLKTGLNRLLHDCSCCGKTTIQENHKISCRSRKLAHVDFNWSRLLTEPNELSCEEIEKEISHDQKDETFVMVRGKFLLPFVQALQGFGSDYLGMITETDVRGTDRKRGRRPRRKVRSLNETVKVPPMQAATLQHHQNYCSNLLSTLSIPALIHCHLTVESRGTIRPGMVINTNPSDSGISKELGFVTAGGFSQSRGEVHGVGVITSEQFLSCLCDASNGDFYAITRQGVRSIALKVRLCTEEDKKYKTKSDVTASLTILS